MTTIRIDLELTCAVGRVSLECAGRNHLFNIYFLLGVVFFFFLSILSVSHINTHTRHTQRELNRLGLIPCFFFSGVFEIEFRHCIFRVGSGPSDG